MKIIKKRNEEGMEIKRVCQARHEVVNQVHHSAILKLRTYKAQLAELKLHHQLMQMLFTRLRWVSMIPLGVPVVPLEKQIEITSSGDTRASVFTSVSSDSLNNS